MSKLQYGRHRRGFSLTEVSITSAMLVLLSSLISNTWIGLGRPLLETAHRCRIAEESTLALACLTRDLGGRLPGDEGGLGGKATYALIGWTQPDGAELWLCFDGGNSPNGIADWAAPDVVISYAVVDHALVRTDQSAGTDFVVARHVNSLALTDLGAEVEITLSFAYRGIFQTYTLIANDP